MRVFKISEVKKHWNMPEGKSHIYKDLTGEVECVIILCSNFCRFWTILHHYVPLSLLHLKLITSVFVSSQALPSFLIFCFISAVCDCYSSTLMIISFWIVGFIADFLRFNFSQTFCCLFVSRAVRPCHCVKLF
jgi:hypothetical protein